MKKLLLISLCLPIIGFGQQTYVPDDNFEQKLIDLGLDNILDDYVDNINIYNITSLSLQSSNILDLIGRETNKKKNQTLLFLYNDGTVEKRIVIE